MKVYIAVLTLLIHTVAPLQAVDLGQESCMPLSCGQMAQLRLSQTGTEKMLKLGIDTVASHFDLKDQANAGLDQADFPYSFNLGSEAMGIKSEIDDVNFNALKFGNSEVDIDKDDVHVCVPVDEMDLSVDAKFDIRGHELSHKGARAYVDQNTQQKPKVCFKGKIGLNGEVENLVHIENDAPEDIGAETKAAMLDMDIENADEDEILFTYMSLYFMEDDMEMPFKFDWLSLDSWGDVGDLFNEVNPENLKKLLDIEKMRDNLIATKGKLPPQPKAAPGDEEGLVNYLGNIKLDLNLEANQTEQLQSDKDFKEDLWDIWQKDSEEKAASAPTTERSGLYGLWDKAAASVTNFANKVGKSASSIGGRIKDKFMNNSEEIIRSRFLPYLQESFNKSVTGSAPVMTAVAKTAEKHLIPLAKEKAAEALNAFQSAVDYQAVMRKSVPRPVFNSQDIVDKETLNRIQDKFDFDVMNTLSEQLREARSRRDLNKIVDNMENVLSNIDHYVKSVNSNSSDMNAHSFMQNKLIPYLENLKNNYYHRSGGSIPKSLIDKTRSLLQETRGKAALVKENYNQRNRELELELSTKWFNEMSGGPELTVATPELCQAGVGALGESSILTEEDLQSYDASGAISTDAINALLVEAAQDGQFDFCLHNDELRTCSSEEGNYNNRCQFENPPQLQWNDKTQKHEIKMKKIRCETRLINAEKKCGVGETKSRIPVLGFLLNAVESGIGSTCKFLSDQADNLATGSVGQNFVDVTVEIEPEICGDSVCMSPKLKDSNVKTDMENVNQGLTTVIGKLVGIVASPITDIVKNQIVDDSLMHFIESEVSQPLESPIGIKPQKIVSENGRITVLSNIETERNGALQQFAQGCIDADEGCSVEKFLRLDQY